ncbi:MAG: Gfo/Idh/MocA family oxidoreductase [Planctomycetes bacterium]|nr:Gfo/Idh/MocA family oxidoreductase [Planctomycetota bacterium]
MSRGASALGAAALAGLPAPAIGRPGEAGKVRMGFVGVGGRGTTHLRTALEIPGVEVTWVCDIDPTRLESAGRLVEEKTGKRPAATEHHRRVLEAKDVDAVLMATPCDVHAPLYLDAIRAGKDLYAEKPLCITAAEADAIVKAAETSVSIVQVGFQSRYSPRVRDGIERLHRGDLGEAVELRAAFLAPFGPLRGWFSKRARSGDWMVEQAVHHFDIMNWALGALPLRAFGMGRADIFTEGEPDRDVHDYYTAIIEYPKDVIVSWVHSWLCPKGGAFGKPFLHVMGRKGGVGLLEGPVEYMDASRPKETLKEEGGNTTRFAQEAFLECVRARKRPFSNVLNGRDAVLVALMVRDAVYGRRVATMEEVKRGG